MLFFNQKKSDAYHGTTPVVVLAKAYALKKPSFQAAKEFVFEQAVLSYEYTVCCARIAELMQEKPNQQEQLKPMVLQAKESASMLLFLYENYIYVPREIIKLHRELTLYNQFLKQFDDKLTEPSGQLSTVSEPCIEKQVNALTGSWNYTRLFTYRSRNLILNLRVLVSEQSHYHRLVSSIHSNSAIYFSYISWLYFIPRTCCNIYAIIRDTLLGSGAHDQGRTFSWQSRLYFSWSQRWFQLGRDPSRIISGLINCFVLTGYLAAYSAATSVAIQIYDVAWGAYKLHQELKSIDALMTRYQDQLKTCPSVDEKQPIEEKIRHLKAIRQYTVDRLSFDVYIDLALLVVAVMLLPGLGLPFFTPVIAAATSVALMIYSKSTIQALEGCKPNQDVSLLGDMGFFNNTIGRMPDNEQCIASDSLYTKGQKQA